MHLEIRIFSYREELSLLLHLFIYSIAYFIWTQRYLFYFMGHNTILSEFTLLLKWFHLWALGTPFNWLSSFQYAPILYLSTFLVSGAIIFSRVILYLPCLSPGISCFFKELLGEVLRLFINIAKFFFQKDCIASFHFHLTFH